jgi:hypothetical protein
VLVELELVHQLLRRMLCDVQQPGAAMLVLVLVLELEHQDRPMWHESYYTQCYSEKGAWAGGWGVDRP